MAKVSAFEKNAKRARLIKRDATKRAALKAIIMDKKKNNNKKRNKYKMPRQSVVSS